MKTTAKQQKQQDRAEAIQSLKRILEKSNGTIYTVLNKVSSSGMTRHISTFVATTDKDGKPQVLNVTWYASRALDYKRNNEAARVIVGGCGMDMGFHVVYSLSRVLYSYDENGNRIENANDAGYKLNHKWL